MPVREAQFRLTLDYRVTPRLTVGLETNGVPGGHPPHDWPGYRHGGDREVLPRATWFISPMSPRSPAVTLGVTSDRLSTPRGQAYFLTFSQNVPSSALTPFVSLKYSSYDRMFAVPFGANLMLDPRTTLQGLYDGNHTHLLLTHQLGRNMAASFILARGRYVGLSLSYGF